MHVVGRERVRVGVATDARATSSFGALLSAKSLLPSLLFFPLSLLFLAEYALSTDNQHLFVHTYEITDGGKHIHTHVYTHH